MNNSHLLKALGRFGPVKLSVELVPKTAWYVNVRSSVSPEQWDVLRQDCYKSAEYKCEVCGQKGSSHPVECHEIWKYYDFFHVQKLEGLIALCPACHQVKHIGLAGKRGYGKEAKEHLQKVNGWVDEETTHYLNLVWQIWEERSKFEWTIDISYLSQKLSQIPR